MIAQEGRPVLLIAATSVAVLHMIFGKVVWPVWIVLLVVLWLYRDPQRAIPPAPNGVVSPVDAVVSAINEKPDPALKRPALCFTLRMAWWQVFRLRSPTEGKIIELALGKKSKLGGMRLLLVAIQTDENDEVTVALRPRYGLGRIRCYIHTGERIGQGRPCGLLPFGGRLEVYVPNTSRVMVSVGQRVSAGSTLLAEFVHRDAG